MARFVSTCAVALLLVSGCKDKTPGRPPPPVNQPPVAAISPAGPLHVLHGASVTLDGTGSADPDGQVVAFAWGLPSGFSAADFGLGAGAEAGASLALTMPLLVPPLPPSLPLTFTLTVTDDDGATAEAAVQVTVLSSQAPVAVIAPAGPVEVRIGSTQVLDASGSYDPDGSIAGYLWALPLGYQPAELGLTSADLAGAQITLLAPPAVPADPNLSFTLRVTDDTGGTGYASVTVIVVTNEAPVAVVAPPAPRRVLPGADLTLDASGSTDDGSIVGYAWTLPAGYSAADLGVAAGDLTSATLTFTAPAVTADTELVFTLTLTDDEGRTTTVEVRVLVDFDDPPVAVITPAGPLDVAHGRALQLIGTESYDPEGTPLTYAWALPAGRTPADFGITAAELDDTGLVLAMPDEVATAWTFGLTVTDAGGAGKSNTAEVTVDLVNTAPELRLFGDGALAQGLTLARGVWTALDFSESVDAEGDPLTLTFAGNLADPACASFSNFGAWGMAAQLSFSGTPPGGCTTPYLLLVTANDGLVDSAQMTITVTLDNAPPSAWLNGPSTLAPSAAGTFDASTSTDPDPGDTLSYSWRVLSVSDPSVDCSTDWGLTDADVTTRTVTAPASPSNPECAGKALVVVTVTDDLGATDSAGVAVTIDAAGPSRTMPASDLTVAQGVSQVTYLFPSPAVESTSTVTYGWSAALLSGPVGCVVGDLGIGPSGWAGADDSRTTTRRRLSAAAGKPGCVFLVTVVATIDGGAEVVSTSFRVTIVNGAPLITVDDAWQAAPGAWSIVLPPTGTPVVRWRATDPNGWTPALSYTVTGDTTPLSCAPTCAGTLTGTGSNPVSLTFVSPPAPGATFSWTVDVFDQAEHAQATIALRIEPCLYVAPGATGGDGTFAQPYGSIQAAIDAALGTAGTNVCLLEGTFVEDVELRASATNTPALSGGYALATGLPLATNRGQASVLQVNRPEGLRFAAGADNRVEHLVVEQAPGFFTSERAAAVTIQDASPTLFGVTARGGAGDPAVGVDIVSAGLVTEPWLERCAVTGSRRAVAGDVIGVSVSRTAGRVSPVLIDGTVAIGDGTAQGVAVAIGPRAEAVLDGVQINDCAGSSGCGFATVIGVYAMPGGGPASFALNRSSITFSGATLADDAYGVLLDGSDGVELRESTIDGWVGHARAVGVADGLVMRDGTRVGGHSTDLRLIDNLSIHGLGSWETMNRCSGPYLATGVLLVGTDGVVVQGNGENGWTGLQGGRASFAHDPASDHVPPSVAGLWLVDAHGVEVAGNVILSGALLGSGSCVKPTPFPATKAFQDGLEGWPGQAAGQASTGLAIDANAVLCSFMAENAMGVYTTCVAADLQGSPDALLTNNIISAYNTNFNIAVRATGVTGVELTNNLLEADFMRGGVVVPPWSVAKWLVFADRIAADGLALHNNLLYLHRDDPEDNPNERLALREQLTGGASSNLAALNHNLLYVQDDLVASTDVPAYARLIGTSTTDYPAASINALPGVGLCSANLVAAPLFAGDEWDKTAIRLDPNPANPALGAADAGRAPAHDIDGDARSGGAIDIGHDEVP